jgi:hypothetical protein
MLSNFVTPPDYVETVVIIDADKTQVNDCSEYCRDSIRPYTVYFYHAGMNDLNWLVRVVQHADCVLQHESSQVPVLQSTKFGPNSNLQSPAEYFNK